MRKLWYLLVSLYRKYALPFHVFLNHLVFLYPTLMVPDDMVQISTSAPGTGYTGLKPFLYKQQREVDRVLGDGNCLFRALSKAISGTKDHHSHLRHAISDFESDNWIVFKPIHEAIISTNFENHIKNIKKLYIWGTSTKIVAAATLFQVEVYVATSA